jgi:hypothetical protein
MLNVKMRPQTYASNEQKEKLVKTENRAYSENATHDDRSLENEEWYD